MSRTFLMILVMAVITYLIRVLPLALFRRRIRSRFIRSFLYYTPYAVLSAMTIPAVLSCTGHVPSSLVGCAAAIVTALCGKKLIVVALIASLFALAAEAIMLLV